ncbi:MAG: hypothetical protein MRQ09_05475 [Candidatus Midichloria sp.]|nr:hypothetical protein [Candidatus Midichloria sp.]
MEKGIFKLSSILNSTTFGVVSMGFQHMMQQDILCRLLEMSMVMEKDDIIIGWF